MAAPGRQSRGQARADAQVFTLEREAHGLADRLPDLLIEADRIATTVAHGIHGRRRAGGETFWQFRQFQTNDAAQLIDWRRSASSDLYVREREWEAAHTVWLWPDLSPSMDFRSHLAPVTSAARARAHAGRGRAAGARRRARRPARPDAADREPQGDDAHGRGHRHHAASPDVTRSLPPKAACRASPARSSSAISSIPSRRCVTVSRSWRAAASPATSCRSSTRPRRRSLRGAHRVPGARGRRALDRRPRRRPARRVSGAARRASCRPRRADAPARLVVPAAPHRPARLRAAADAHHAPARGGGRLSLARDAEPHRARRRWRMSLGALAFLNPGCWRRSRRCRSSTGCCAPCRRARGRWSSCRRASSSACSRARRRRPRRRGG